MKKFLLFTIALYFSLSISAQTEKFSSVDCIPVPAVCYPLPVNIGGLGIGMSFVSLNQIQNTSGHTTGVFENYTCTDSTLLYTGTSYVFHATTGQTYEESVTAWIDFNNDGDFASSEIVFHDSAIVYSHQGAITIPSGVQNQNVPIRMRVGSVASGPVLTGCNQPLYGEYEDYKVYYGLNNGIDEPKNKIHVTIQPNPFHESATLIISGNEAMKEIEMNIYNSFGQHIRTEFFEDTSSMKIERKDLPGGLYFYSVAGKGEIKASGKFIVD